MSDANGGGTRSNIGVNALRRAVQEAVRMHEVRLLAALGKYLA